MISVLHILATFHIIFTLLADHVQLHPLELSDNITNGHHGHTHKETCRKTQASSSKAPLALASPGHSSALLFEAGQDPAQAGQPSLQRPGLHCTHQGNNGQQCIQLMAMSDLQEDLQPSTPILWRMWCVMASMLRPNISSSAEKPESTTVRAVELCHRLDCAKLGWPLASGTYRRCTMDNIAEAQNPLQTQTFQEEQAERLGPIQGSQGQKQGPGHRNRIVWPAGSSQRRSRSSMAVLHEHDCSHYASPCTSKHGGQATQDHNGSFEEAQRSLASRAAIYGQRSCHKGGTTANKTTACSGRSPWSCSKRAPTGSTCTLQFAQRVERIPEPGCQTVARLQCPIPRPGKANERTGCHSNGNVRSGQRSLSKGKIDCRHRAQRGHDECQRRRARKGSDRTSCRPHQGRSDESAIQPRSSPKLSRADGRRRAESPETTQVGRWSSRHFLQAIGLACCTPGVWIGRVNNNMDLIAHRPFQYAVEVPAIIPKWLHTVHQEPSFVSEWTALDTAFHLALELGILPTSSSGSQFRSLNPLTATPASHDVSMQPLSRPRKHHHSKIRFNCTICVRIGDDFDDVFHDFALTSCALRSTWKPWSLHAACEHEVDHHRQGRDAICLQPFSRNDQSLTWALMRSEEISVSQEMPLNFEPLERSDDMPECILHPNVRTQHLPSPAVHPTDESRDVGLLSRTSRMVHNFEPPDCPFLAAHPFQPMREDNQCQPDRHDSEWETCTHISPMVQSHEHEAEIFHAQVFDAPCSLATQSHALQCKWSPPNAAEYAGRDHSEAVIHATNSEPGILEEQRSRSTNFETVNHDHDQDSVKQAKLSCVATATSKCAPLQV